MEESSTFGTTMSDIIIIISIIVIILYSLVLMFIERILDNDLNDIHFKLPKKKRYN